MTTELLMGDEAVALAAIHAGIGGAFSYPGTPATEIFEFVQALAAGNRNIAARWSANEKVAYEAALGMSYTGKRALVSMKHVGLNVAADPFMSSALTGANGGLVVAVADDPGMYSSQNEQDTRFYAMFAQIPLLEPSNQQEAYEMTGEAFEISERLQTPVLIKLVTRLAHSRGAVRVTPPAQNSARPRATDWREWTLLPVNARKRFQRLLDLQSSFMEYTERTPFNRLELRGPHGVIASGLGFNYLCEALGERHNFSVLKIGAYPLPVGLVRRLVDHCTEITLLEEGYPLIEKQLRGVMGVPGKRIRGKRDGALPPQGELTVDVVRRALGRQVHDERPALAGLPARPPQLCQGCPHCDTYGRLLAALDSDTRPFLFGDIGCYTLAALPPYNAVDTCVDMGASIGMAIGAARAGAHPVIATIGDSTFIHSGMTALIEAVHDDLNMTVVILDNAIVAMTGGQEVFATGDDLIRIVRGLGVNEEHLVRIEPTPKNAEANLRLMQREIGHRGLSVIVAARPCIHAKRELDRIAVTAAAESLPLGATP
jgi:indolepyruvate ferredoxin oxidoreductase alpha subunit